MSDIKGGASQAHVPASCHSNSEAISDETSLEPWWLPNQIAHVQISGRVTRRCNYRVLLFSGSNMCVCVREKLYRCHEEAEPGEAAGEGDLSGERAHLGSGPRAGRASGGGAKE